MNGSRVTRRYPCSLASNTGFAPHAWEANASFSGRRRGISGNRLEKLSGDRTGQWSIRINNQWRICFTFANGDVFDVEIVDYH